MNSNEAIERQYTYAVLEGSSYEVGKQQAEALMADKGTVEFFTKPCDEFGSLTSQDLDQIIRFNEQYCPGLNEEIKGFADTLQVPAENVIYYAASYPRGGACSHMAVLPEITRDGHLYVGRSYEWSLDDEMRLCTTRIKGKAAHMGFSIFQFGRFDGMNEHGLTVTMSMGVPGPSPKEKGVRFWVVIKTLLENCKTVNEAEKFIREIPISFYLNLMVADKTGEAALFEIACSKMSVKRIGPMTKEKYLCSTNHYNQPEMLGCDTNRMWQSLARYKAMADRLETKKPAIDKETIRHILSSHMPEGVACHYYKDWLGTLWSLLFDVTSGSMEVCFGSPVHNPWRSFSLGDSVGITTYRARFIDDKVPEPGFWRRLPNGCNDLNG